MRPLDVLEPKAKCRSVRWRQLIGGLCALTGLLLAGGADQIAAAVSTSTVAVAANADVVATPIHQLLSGAMGSPTIAAPAGRETLLLIDRALAVTRIERFGVAGEELIVWPARERGGAAPELQRIPLAECLAVVRPSSAPAGGQPILNYADGQRFPGEPRMKSEPGQESLWWRHRWLGEVAASIDSLRSIVLVPDTNEPKVGATDVIALANGDRMEGLVHGLGPNVLLERLAGGSDAEAGAGLSPNRPSNTGTEVDTPKSGDPPPATRPGLAAGSTSEVPLARIAAIAFITPIAPATGHRLWCADGTVVQATPTIDLENGLLQIRLPSSQDGPASPSGSPDSDSTRRKTIPILRQEEVLGFVPDPARLVALASIAPEAVLASGATPRFHVEGPSFFPGTWPVGAAPIVLRGPATVQYRMPSRGCALVCEIRMADPDPAWTDFDVVVRDGEREVFRRHLTGDGPTSDSSMDLGLTLETDRLTIELTEGDQGPIRDAIEIRRALIVVPKS